MRRKILDQYGINCLTLTVVEWIDVFTRKDYRDIIIESLKYCIENEGLVVHAYVIMSNHVHLIVRAEYARAGRVSDAPDYLYISARNYTYDKNVLLEITPYAGIVFD